MRELCESDTPLTISAISTKLGIAPSSVHRALESLVKARWVERMATHQYRLAFEFYRLGALAASRIKPVELSRPLLAKLAIQCDETALFAMRIPGALQMLFAEQAESPQTLRYRFPLHEPRFLFWGAPARAILAWMPEEQQREALATAPPSITNRRPPAWSTWEREAREVRQQGYAVTRGHYTNWAVGVAVPVFGLEQEVVGALTIIAPEMRVQRNSERRFATALQVAAAHLSRSLGAPASSQLFPRTTIQIHSKDSHD